MTTESEDHARLVRTVEEWARLAKQPPTPARRARLAQLEREKQHLAALYRQQVQDGPKAAPRTVRATKTRPPAWKFVLVLIGGFFVGIVGVLSVIRVLAWIGNYFYPPGAY